MYKFWLTREERRRLDHMYRDERARNVKHRLMEAFQEGLLHGPTETTSQWAQWRRGDSQLKKDLEATLDSMGESGLRAMADSLWGR